MKSDVETGPDGELLPVKPSIKQWLDLVQANSEALRYMDSWADDEY